MIYVIKQKKQKRKYLNARFFLLVKVHSKTIAAKNMKIHLRSKT